MADTDKDLTIDVSGNTASIATDYLFVNGLSADAAHVQLTKMVWGASAEAFRVSQTTPLPVNIYSTNPTARVGITGSITGNVTVTNTGVTGSVVYVKGSTGYELPVTGRMQGVTNGTLVGVTGTVRLVQPVIVGGAGSTGATLNPIAITGGRYLSSSTDSVNVTGTVTVSGGRVLNAATDTISVLGSDLGSKVLTRMYDGSGATLTSTSGALDVNIKNAGFTATVTIGASVGVFNYNNVPLVVAGSTSGAAIVVKGENGDAIEVTATTPLNVDVTNEVSIDDRSIVSALSSENSTLISKLTDVKTNTASIASIKTDITSGNLRAKISEITRPSKVSSATISLSPSTTQISANTPLLVGITLKASSSNTAIIYVGGAGLVRNPVDGYPLEPGESIYIECSNINALYARSVEGTQQISYIGS